MPRKSVSRKTPRKLAADELRAEDAAPTGNGRDVAAYSPVNRANALNQLSNGATQSTTSTQSAPITQNS